MLEYTLGPIFETLAEKLNSKSVIKLAVSIIFCLHFARSGKYFIFSHRLMLDAMTFSIFYIVWSEVKCLYTFIGFLQLLASYFGKKMRGNAYIDGEKKEKKGSFNVLILDFPVILFNPFPTNGF